MTTLPQEHAIIYPYFTNKGRPLKEELFALSERMLKAFGGLHMYDVNGSWIAPNRQSYVRHEIKFISSFIPTEDNLKTFYTIVNEALKSSEEECLYISTPSGVEFIKSSSVKVN